MGGVLATFQQNDGSVSVISGELCILREIVVANSLTFSVVKDGKLFVQGCIMSVGKEGKLYVVIEGDSFALTKYEIDLSKFQKYAPKDVFIFKGRNHGTEYFYSR